MRLRRRREEKQNIQHTAAHNRNLNLKCNLINSTLARRCCARSAFTLLQFFFLLNTPCREWKMIHSRRSRVSSDTQSRHRCRRLLYWERKKKKMGNFWRISENCEIYNFIILLGITLCVLKFSRLENNNCIAVEIRMDVAGRRREKERTCLRGMNSGLFSIMEKSTWNIYNVNKHLN